VDSPSLPVLSSLQPIIGQCRWVVFHPERLEAAVELWDDSLAGRHTWHHPCHFFDGTAETVRWIFVVDVLNHCFWPDEGRPAWTVRYQGRDYSGYWGLAACLNGPARKVFPSPIRDTWPSSLKGICVKYSGVPGKRKSLSWGNDFPA